MKIGDIVGIRWVDAIVRDHADSSTNLACPTAITYGKLVFQCDGYVSVAAEEFLDLDTKGDLRQVTSIPTGMILESWSLQRKGR